MDIEILNIPAKDKVKLEKWAEITVEKWKFSLSKFKLIDAGTLFNSFAYTISNDANNNTALISFAFEYYLRMLDMGVGKGVKLSDVNYSKSTEGRDAKYKTGRRKYPVYSKILYSEVLRLGELLTNQYAVAGATVIVDDFKHGLTQKTIY
jgi:hypothetical protein